MCVKKLGLTFFSILRMSIRDILEISKAPEMNNFRVHHIIPHSGVLGNIVDLEREPWFP